MRLLIFGGRAYADWVAFCHALEPFRGHGQALTVIHGLATGADSMADKWAQIHRARIEQYPADWTNIGRPGAKVKIRPSGSAYDTLAGFVRNQRMIDEGKPDRAVQFPGGSGTKDMHDRLIKAGIKIFEPYPKKPLYGLFS